MCMWTMLCSRCIVSPTEGVDLVVIAAGVNLLKNCILLLVHVL
jgi:hypothetical protein